MTLRVRFSRGRCNTTTTAGDPADAALFRGDGSAGQPCRGHGDGAVAVGLLSRAGGIAVPLPLVHLRAVLLWLSGVGAYIESGMLFCVERVCTLFVRITETLPRGFCWRGGGSEYVVCSIHGDPVQGGVLLVTFHHVLILSLAPLHYTVARVVFIGKAETASSEDCSGVSGEQRAGVSCIVQGNACHCFELCLFEDILDESSIEVLLHSIRVSSSAHE